MPGKIETLTLNQFMTLLRDHGIRCSYGTVKAYIQAGGYPFARCEKPEPEDEDKKTKWRFIIFKREAIEWLEARCG